MLYLFSGNDTAKKLSSYEKVVAGLPRGTEMFLVSYNNFDPHEITNLYSGSSLFSAQSAITFQNILERDKEAEYMFSHLQEMSNAQNVFIFLESHILKPVLDKFKKAGAETAVFDLPVGPKSKKFDNFLLANAFGARDKLNSWLLFRQAMNQPDASLDALAGMLFWKIKDMLVRRNFSLWSEAELKTLSVKIALVLPEARSKNADAGAALEAFLIQAFEPTVS